MQIGGGMSMLKALWRMSEINTTPVLSPGDDLPLDIPVQLLQQDAQSDGNTTSTTLHDLASSARGVPTIINFGSCS